MTMNKLPLNPVPKGLKILIVEDHALIYYNLQRFFQAQGFSVLAPPEGIEIIDSYETALKAIELEMPQIAVLDIELKSKKNGMDLGLLLNSKYNIPCVFLTGIAHRIDPVAAIRISSAPTISKISKSAHNAQLLSSVAFIWGKHMMIHPEETEYKVTFVMVNKDNYNQITIPDPTLYSWKIKWNEVKFITSFNAKLEDGGNNHILIHRKQTGAAYKCSRKLYEVETCLPDHFIRISRDVIINLEMVVQYQSSGRLELDDYTFSFSEVYKKRNLHKLLSYMQTKNNQS